MSRYMLGFPIKPMSVVKLIKDYGGKHSKYNVGRMCRIGFYSKKDGLDVIWLVDQNGNYCSTLDHEFLELYFEVVEESNVFDYHGLNCDVINCLDNPSLDWMWKS